MGMWKKQIMNGTRKQQRTRYERAEQKKRTPMHLSDNSKGRGK
jgi:hypothetical protein